MSKWVKFSCLFGSILVLQGCILDLYGGNPRLQIENQAAGWRVDQVGIGDTLQPVWYSVFDPPVVSGTSSAVVESPVAGRVRLHLRLRDTTGDTLLQTEVQLQEGDFLKLLVDLDSNRSVRIR